MILPAGNREPAVTIVLIGLNVERFLPDCLASIRQARFPQEWLERIYVDSGSTDASVELVSCEPGWQVLPLNDPRPSVAKGRNRGIVQARSAFVQLLDADMLLDAEWLAVAVGLLRADQNLAAVFGRTIERYPDRNIYYAMRNSIWSLHPLGVSDRLPGASMMRREAIAECGLHRTEVRGFEDVELAQRFLAAGYTLQGRPEVMCLHDSDIHTFGKYWRSNLRGGQANYDILRSTRGEQRKRFWRELRRSVLWPVLLAAGILGAVMFRNAAIAVIPAAGFGLALAREVNRGRRSGGSWRCGRYWCLHWALSKVPYTLGYLQACWAGRGRRTRKERPMAENASPSLTPKPG